jgi:PadR family transcriptional regulator, regulatory protein PadR
MHDIEKQQVLAWKSQLKKGTLELAVLMLLRQQRRYGLEILELLNKSNLDISSGSIYPVLSRLRNEKKVTTEWIDEGVGHARKYYKLTASGTRILTGTIAAWREYSAALDELIDDG